MKRTSHQDNLEEFYSGDIEEGTVNVHKEPVEQFVAILEVLKKRSTMAIQDDYETWKANNCSKQFSKLLLIDQADYGTQQIFFDDNAEEGDSCVVDVRDVISGEEIPYKKYINKYVMRVEPHRAILEPDYFIKLLEQAEQERDQEVSIHNHQINFCRLIELRLDRSQMMNQSKWSKRMSGKNYRKSQMKNTS